MNKKSKRFIILAGANGTGKTTIATELLKEYSVEFLNADILADKAKGRISAGKAFFSLLNKTIKRKASVALESTLSGNYLIKVIKKVKRLGYRLSIFYIFVDTPEVALERIKARVEGGGHDVPKADVIRRFHRSKVNFWEQYKDIVDEWTIIYNGMEKLIPVATGDRSSFEIIDEGLFKLYQKGK
ncbi:MAG: zeta toxin family protein [Candidatus Saganbacteria bacterium]|nr:zeta toxin family protein [Candidatus Saganbacteria bacterium]